MNPVISLKTKIFIKIINSFTEPETLNTKVPISKIYRTAEVTIVSYDIRTIDKIIIRKVR